MTVGSVTRPIPRRGLFPDWAALAISFLFSFSGRIGCSSYWLLLIGNLLASVVINFAVADRLPADIGPWVTLAVLILSFISGASACVRRLHDLNYSGWWAFLLLTPFLGLLGLVYLGIAPGDKMHFPIIIYVILSFYLAIFTGINSGWIAGLSLAGASFLSVVASGSIKASMWYGDKAQKIAGTIIAIPIVAIAFWISDNFVVRLYGYFLSGAEWTLIGAAIGFVFTDKKLASRPTPA